MADDKKLDLNEIRQKLAKGLKERVETFGAKCAELAAKEKAALGELKKAAPTGKAEVPKKDLSDSDAFGISWKQYKDTKKKKEMKKDDMSQVGGDMEMKEPAPDKAKINRDFPSIAESYESTPDAHPGAKSDAKTTNAKRMKKFEEKMSKAKKCAKCGKTMCKCMKMSESKMKKDEDLVDGPNSNIPGKQLKRIGGKETVLPSDKPVKVIEAPGSGGEPVAMKKSEELKKEDLKPGHSFSLSPVKSESHSDLKPGTEISLSPVSHLKAPPAEKRAGMVQRIHAAAKARMSKSDDMSAPKGDTGSGTQVPSTAPLKAPPPNIMKAEEMKKEHIGFDALKEKVEKEGHSAESAAKIAGSIGIKKMGKKKMAAKAAAGKKK